MATEQDVIEADERMEDALEELSEKSGDTDVILATQAVCYAVQGLAIRLDFVLRDIGSDRPRLSHFPERFE